MAEDLYNDGGAAAAPQSSAADESEPQDNPQEEQAEQAPDKGEMTAVLPKELLMGKDAKPGDEVRFKITAIHGDEVSVAPCDDSDNYGEDNQSAKAPADSQMASLME